MHKRSTKFYRKNEVKVMEQLGFRPTVNSGSVWFDKEDGKNDFALCQLKSTDKQSMSIKQLDLRTLETNAAISHKIPIFAIQFLNTGEVWVMIKPEDIENVKNLINGKIDKEQLKTSFENNDLGIDVEAKLCYDDNVKTNENKIARMNFKKQKEMELEKIKKQRKENNKTWRKNLNKKE